MDFGSFELLIVLLIILLVLGPKELVKLANSTGRWMGKMKHEINNFKVMAKEELEAEELRIDESEKAKKITDSNSITAVKVKNEER